MSPYEETGPIELPMQSNRPILVLVALLAGGLTAALVLAILHFFFDPQPQPDSADSAPAYQVESLSPES